MRIILSTLALFALIYVAPSSAEVLIKINVADSDAVEIYSVAGASSAVNNNNYSPENGIVLLGVLKGASVDFNDTQLLGSLVAAGTSLPFYDKIVLSAAFAASLNIFDNQKTILDQEFVTGERAFFGKGVAPPDFLDLVTLQGVGATGDIVAGYLGNDVSAVLGQWEIVSEPAVNDAGRISLEEPINGAIHGGIGNLRGFAFFDDAVETVEVYIDGEYAFDAPYGGSRSDVGNAFPDFDDSDDSGFSLAYGYSNLAPGNHTILVRARGADGVLGEDSAAFTVVGFQDIFIASNDVVDGSNASIAMSGDEIRIDDLQVGDAEYTVVMKWRTAEQGFEIIEIYQTLLIL